MTTKQHANQKAGHSLISESSCNKLSPTAKGKIQYQVWQHNDDKSYSICISGNESSGGFSNELVLTTDIIKKLKHLVADNKPFHATALKDLFIGKSVNNHCFLAAILVNEQVIQPHPMTARLLEVNPNFELWLESLKTQKTSDSPNAPSPMTKDQKSKKSKAVINNQPIEEQGDVCHQEQSPTETVA